MSKEQQNRLDEGLAMTFPASDPVAVGKPTSTEPPARPLDRKPPLPSPAGRTSHSAARQTRKRARLRRRPDDPIEKSSGRGGPIPKRGE